MVIVEDIHKAIQCKGKCQNSFIDTALGSQNPFSVHSLTALNLFLSLLYEYILKIKKVFKISEDVVLRAEISELKTTLVAVISPGSTFPARLLLNLLLIILEMVQVKTCIMQVCTLVYSQVHFPPCQHLFYCTLNQVLTKNSSLCFIWSG